MQTITSPTPQANTLALKDIHLPEQITNYPIAYGWLILTALLLVAIIIIVIKVKKISKRNQVKKQALVQIRNNLKIDNSELISLLKWTAIHYFSRIEVANLYGESLQNFLLKHLPEKHKTHFTKLSEQGFKKLYQPNFQNEVDKNFQQAARLWLTHALPPSNNTQAKPIDIKQKTHQKNKEVSA